MAKRNLLENRPDMIHLENMNYALLVSDIADETAERLCASQRALAEQIVKEVREQLEKERIERESIKDNLILIKVGPARISLSIWFLYLFLFIQQIINLFKK